MTNKIFVAIFPIFLLSCEGILFEEQDNTYILIDKQQDKLDLLNGVYSQLVKMYNESYLTALVRSDDLNIYINYSFNYPNQTGWIGCSNGGSNYYDFLSLTGEIYKHLYLAILNTNNLIVNLDERTDRKIVG